ncbi:MAG: hypothetical protein ACOCVC_08345 [Spirochaeta sp.]
MDSVNFCVCCGEIIDNQGDPCPFCGFAEAITAHPSYRETFVDPLERVETRVMLVRIEEMLGRLECMDRELTEMIKAVGVQ